MIRNELLENELAKKNLISSIKLDGALIDGPLVFLLFLLLQSKLGEIKMIHLMMIGVNLEINSRLDERRALSCVSYFH